MYKIKRITITKIIVHIIHNNLLSQHADVHGNQCVVSHHGQALEYTLKCSYVNS